MAAIYSNGDNRWDILGFNFTKRDALSSVYKISMGMTCKCGIFKIFFVIKLIIYMKTFLNSDWPRAVHFFLNIRAAINIWLHIT
jgi:hypothetical protein